MGSDEKIELVKTKGAAHCINYNKENLRDRLMELTGGAGADIIMDSVGGDIFKHCLRRYGLMNYVIQSQCHLISNMGCSSTQYISSDTQEHIFYSFTVMTSSQFYS